MLYFNFVRAETIHGGMILQQRVPRDALTVFARSVTYYYSSLDLVSVDKPSHRRRCTRAHLLRADV
jgi:hypothetical protein